MSILIEAIWTAGSRQTSSDLRQPVGSLPIAHGVTRTTGTALIIQTASGQLGRGVNFPDDSSSKPMMPENKAAYFVSADSVLDGDLLIASTFVWLLLH